MSQPFIEHVVEHYLARDKWRIAMQDYQGRNYSGVHGLYVPTASHYRMNGDRLKDASIDQRVVHNTRDGLKRVKETTVEYLHELLHKEDCLQEFEHHHQGEDIFHFVIEEVLDVPDLRSFLGGP